MSEKRSDYKPRDYDGGESLDNFHANFQVVRDIEFMKRLLPSYYVVQESSTRGSIHCKSDHGIRLSPYLNTSTGAMVTDAEDEEMWSYIVGAIKQHFSSRFQEIFHNTCFCHTDFTVYLKQVPNTK